MTLSKKYRNIVLSVLIVLSLLFSGCTGNQKPTKEEDTSLPSLTRHDIEFLQQQSLNFFDQYINTSTGYLTIPSTNLSITDHILTGHVYADLKEKNNTFPGLLQQNINSIVRRYNDNPNQFNLLQTSLLLDLLYKTPESTSNPSLEHDLADRILNYSTNQHFNTTPILSNEAGQALTALSKYTYYRQNESSQTNLTQLINYYVTELQTTDLSVEKGYFKPWFTQSLYNLKKYNLSNNRLYPLIATINNQLISQQELSEIPSLGKYSHPAPMLNNSLQFQFYCLQSMITSYNQSQTQNDTINQSDFHQSIILNLIYLKNTLVNMNNLTPQQHLIFLPIIHQTNTVLSSDSWTYLWDSSTQTLIEGKELETSNTLWTALTIGVMGSIGLLSLVFIIIRLYYKNQN